ncbi:DUF2815 family protein [Salmonella enterica subsp. enterica serovar Bareilly]|nr:DUF2815 family protein [Salmonella enterica subsp. enterica serovar Bareilly]
MKIRLNGVCNAFCHVFEATDFEGDGNFKFRDTFLIPKNSELDKQIWAAIRKVAKDAWGDKYEKILESIKHIPNRAGYRDGNTKDYEGFEGHMFLTASNEARPLVIDRDRSPLVAADGRPYSGCFVNATVTVYAYDFKGKGIGFSLGGVQFFKDGDAFTGGRPATVDDFDDVSEGADADSLI